MAWMAAAELEELIIKTRRRTTPGHDEGDHNEEVGEILEDHNLDSDHQGAEDVGEGNIVEQGGIAPVQEEEGIQHTGRIGGR